VDHVGSSIRVIDGHSIFGVGSDGEVLEGVVGNEVLEDTDGEFISSPVVSLRDQNRLGELVIIEFLISR